MPEPHPANRDIIDLVTVAAGQWRLGPAGPVGLDWPALARVAESMGIETDEMFYRKLAIFERAALEAMRRDDN